MATEGAKHDGQVKEWDCAVSEVRGKVSGEVSEISASGVALLSSVAGQATVV